MGASIAKRTYLVVVDDSEESRVALRFAARRAAKTKGRIEIIGLVEPQDFVQWGGVQSAIEEEQRLRIAGVVSAAVGEILDEAGFEVNVIVQKATRRTTCAIISAPAKTSRRWSWALRQAAIRGRWSPVSAAMIQALCPVR